MATQHPAEQLHPATGAWMPGDPPGHRQFLQFPASRPFALDSGTTMHGVTVAYETWGALDDSATNAVLLCHAWTGDSHVTGPAGRGHEAPGWWSGLIGPGLAIDTDRWFVVCANVLGGCQGSTGPASIDPAGGSRYASHFPVVTIRDMVRAQARLADHLGVDVWQCVVGGSLGGMQVLEWAITYPQRVRSIMPIATCAQATAQQIAWGAIGRRAIRLDPKWRDGEYYGAAPGDGPTQGLAVARMVAQVTFRSDNVFTEKFGRGLADGATFGGNIDLWQRFEVESYLDHHGAKLVRRFDANSYLIIGKAMDLHDVGRGRGGLVAAMRRITMPSLVVGISSDILYPTYQQHQIHELLAGVSDSRYAEVDSPHGHDAFLIDIDQVAPMIDELFTSVAKG